MVQIFFKMIKMIIFGHILSQNDKILSQNDKILS